MVYNPEGVRGQGVEVVLCNPVLEEVSQKEDFFEEGCLSFPEIYADVKARRGTRVRTRPKMTQHKYTLIRALCPTGRALCGHDIP